MLPRNAHSKTGGCDIVCGSARKFGYKSRILFSRRFPGLPHGPVTETTLKGTAVRLVSAEPLRPLRSVAGTALVPQRLAAVIAPRCFFRIELDRFHCSTVRMLWLQSGLTFLEHLHR